MIGLDVGAAWAPAPNGPVTVRAVFTQAIHVECGDGRLLVIVNAEGPSGPLHLRVDALPRATHGSRLHLARIGIELSSVPPWRPPPLARALSARSLPAPPLPGAERSALAAEHELVRRVRACLGLDDLGGVAQLLGGRGPGLTPAGDDVLAGIVLARHASGADGRRLRAAVALVHSTDLSLAYLWWAARGQCIQPAHEVLAALAGDDPQQVRAAAARLSQHGASSGHDLLFGIECALRTAGAPATPP